MWTEAVTISGPPLPGNSQYIVWFDTTAITNLPRAAGASAPAPGVSRSMFANYRFDGTILAETQDITVTLQIMTKPSLTTSSAFETDTGAYLGGTWTATAGTTYAISWLARTNDYRILLQAGATAPSAIITTGRLFYGDRSPGA